MENVAVSSYNVSILLTLPVTGVQIFSSAFSSQTHSTYFLLRVRDKTE
jgi:hypothetical protein